MILLTPEKRFFFLFSIPRFSLSVYIICLSGRGGVSQDIAATAPNETHNECTALMMGLLLNEMLLIKKVQGAFMTGVQVKWHLNKSARPRMCGALDMIDPLLRMA